MQLSPRTWRILRSRRLRIFLACSPFVAVALVAIAYPVANWIGRRAMKNFIESLPGRGLPTDFAACFKPGDDASADVFRHPAMLAEQASHSLTSLPLIEPPITGLAKKEPKLDLAFAKTSDLTQWFSPPAADEKEADRRVLDGVRPQSQRLAALREALARPDACWILEQVQNEFTKGQTISTVFPSQSRLRSISSFAASEARASLALGDSATAAADATAILDCVRHLLDSRPTLTSTLTAKPVANEARDLIHEGILRLAWNDPQLAGFEARLAKLDPQKAQVQAFGPEAAFLATTLPVVESLASKPGGIDFKDGWKADRQIIRQRLRAIWWQARPAGLGMLDSVESQRILFDHWPLHEGQARSRFEAEEMQEFSRRHDAAPIALFADGSWTTEQRDAVADAWGQLAGQAKNALSTETAIAILRCGIALERHRLQQGAYPAALPDLVPSFLPAVPIDPFSRQPLRYERMADGSPRLWSIGENLTDEGGLPNRNREKGDLVWITRPIPGFTPADYRR